MRKYEYETGRFISIDPLWAKYYGWSPYQYSMNSPVMLVDEGGEKIQALNQAARDAIVGSVESRFEQFVRFDDDGMLDAAYLKNNLPSNLDVNSNAATLARLAENPALATVSVQKDFTVKNSKGKDENYSLWDNKSSKGQELSLGAVTVFPKGKDADFTDMYSTQSNVTQIYINPDNYHNKEPYSKRVAHELFIHFRFFLLNLPNRHGDFDRPDWQNRYEKQSQE